MRYLKLFLYCLLGVILLFCVSAVIVANVYEDDVKAYVIARLNNHLQAPVVVDPQDIDLTLIKDFPYASLQFRNIKVLEPAVGKPKKKKNILFASDLVALRFNILDILRKNYRIKKVKAKQTELFLKIDKQGKDNYHFWKTSADTSSSDFSLDLEKFIFNDLKVSYHDLEGNFAWAIDIDHTEFSGKFNDEKYFLEISGKGQINFVQNDTTRYLQDKKLSVDMSLFVDNRANYYEISKGDVFLEENTLNVEGKIITSDYEDVYDLMIKGNDLRLGAVIDLFPIPL